MNPLVLDEKGGQLAKPVAASPGTGWWRAILPAVAWAALLFALSSIPGHRFPAVRISVSDKILHGCVYAVLGALCFRALVRTTSLRAGKAVLVAAVIALGYGISDEIHQMFVPKRASELLDVVADLVGGTAGAAATHFFYRWRKHP